jgi:HD superfamily phosphohydrolase
MMGSASTTIYQQQVDAFEQELRNSRLSPIVESYAVQRLKDIAFIPPLCLRRINEVHSRYEHSIGVAYLAHLLATSSGLSKDGQDTLIVAGLLHDIGHAPFSHAAEQFLAETRRRYHHANGLRLSARIGRTTDPTLSVLVQHAINALYRGRGGLWYQVFDGIWSADNIDGIYRSCRTFEMDAFDPLRVINDLRIEPTGGHLVTLPGDAQSEARQAVFHSTREIYHDRLRSNYVMAAEAMLVRALYAATEHDATLPHQLDGLNDMNLIERLSAFPDSRDLIQLLLKGTPYIPLWGRSAKVAHQFLAEVGWGRSRCDIGRRRLLEERIARTIGARSTDVIVYVTSEKQIVDGLPTQMELDFSSSGFGVAHVTKPPSPPTKRVRRGRVLHIFVHPHLGNAVR